MDAEGSNPGGFALPRSVRITQPGEIRALFRRGKRRKTHHLDAFISPSPVAFSRLGVVVPKHRHEIVERNQVKRRLREVGRTVLLPGLGNSGRALDVLLRARPEAYSASYAELHAELLALTEALCSPAS
jgi:ribonuclease P protein component